MKNMPCMEMCCGGRKEWLEQQEREMAAKRAHFELWYKEHHVAANESIPDASVIHEAESVIDEVLATTA